MARPSVLGRAGLLALSFSIPDEALFFMTVPQGAFAFHIAPSVHSMLDYGSGRQLTV